MIIRRKKHIVPGLNTTSTADISFMLLTFFLVTTSMDADKGIMRQLPPASQVQQQQVTMMEKSRTMVFKITADNHLWLNGKPVDERKVKQELVDFIAAQGKRHLITIEADANADYNAYFQVQDEIASAYATVRNQVAKQHYGRSFNACSQEQRDTIRKLVPQRLSETLQGEGGQR